MVSGDGTLAMEVVAEYIEISIEILLPEMRVGLVCQTTEKRLVDALTSGSGAIGAASSSASWVPCLLYERFRSSVDAWGFRAATRQIRGRTAYAMFPRPPE
jgi:hypothetical protein